ncbi:hypothetical protein CPB85DRAFT_1430771 [Mucidula mucida]|nr:hypothetical protein CPB85DRAFT_1430771 [Mucidula mucida]
MSLLQIDRFRPIFKHDSHLQLRKPTTTRSPASRPPLRHTLEPTGRPTTARLRLSIPQADPTTRSLASRPLMTSTHAFDSTSRPDDTLSRKPTASTPPSRTTDFDFLFQRHITPAGRPTLDIANRPTTCGSCKSTASDQFSSTTRTFSSASRPDDTLSRKPTAHDVDSRLRFYKPNRRHVIPQADRLCAPPLIRGRPTSTFYSTSRPMKLYSRKTTDSQHRKSTDDI